MMNNYWYLGLLDYLATSLLAPHYIACFYWTKSRIISDISFSRSSQQTIPPSQSRLPYSTSIQTRRRNAARVWIYWHPPEVSQVNTSYLALLTRSNSSTSRIETPHIAIFLLSTRNYRLGSRLLGGRVRLPGIHRRSAGFCSGLDKSYRGILWLTTAGPNRKGLLSRETRDDPCSPFHGVSLLNGRAAATFC